jgi:hypothetical protein
LGWPEAANAERDVVKVRKASSRIIAFFMKSLLIRF